MGLKLRNQIFQQTKFAFTLAEVLITIAVIGVVASVTLPMLIKKYEQYQTVIKLKVAYRILSQAVEQSIAYNGELDEWDYSLNATEFNDKYITPYLKIIKQCRSCNCGKSYYDLVEQNDCIASKSYILSNGMILYYIKDSFGFINYVVDLNGNKGKNTLGRDVFVFYLFNHTSPIQQFESKINMYKSGLYPGSLGGFGVPHWYIDRDLLLSTSVSRGCNKNISEQRRYGGTGSACATVIVKDGWKIKEDYPW